MLFWKMVLKFVLQDVTKGDSHQLMLARLDWELEQRKRYSDQIYTCILKFIGEINLTCDSGNKIHPPLGGYNLEVPLN